MGPGNPPSGAGGVCTVHALNALVGRRALTVLAGLFVASRVGYFIAGVRFDAGMLIGGWQILDPTLLADDLLRSVWYLHAQPPLFNLLLGSGLKIAGSHAASLLALLWSAMGLAIGVGLYGLLRDLGCPERWATILAGVYLVSPTSVLYENWLTYSVPVAALLVWSARYVGRWASEPSPRRAAWLFSMLAAVVLIRSMFHLAWLLAILGLLMLVRRDAGRKLLLAASIPLLLVLAVYVKNAALFGSFSTTSWLGMNLSRITVDTLPGQTRERLIAEGRLSAVAGVEAFSPPEAYAGIVEPPAPLGHPAVDATRKSTGTPNYNHLLYLEAARDSRANALSMVGLAPVEYLSNVLQALTIYLRPPGDEIELWNANPDAIGPLRGIFDALLYGCFGGANRTGFLAVLALLVNLAGTAGLLVRGRHRGWDGQEVSLLFVGFVIAYVTAVGTLFELGENHRFRFMIDPLVLAGAVAHLRRWFVR